MKNIVLIGMPGSGKSTIGNILAGKLEREFLDVDEYIKDRTGIDPAEHLAKMTDDEFLDMESQMTQTIDTINTVVSTTGSVPLREPGINHLRNTGITFWLDTHKDILIPRHRLKGDNRVVGKKTMTFEEIIEFRNKHYKNNHDHRLKLKDETPEEISEMIIQILK